MNENWVLTAGECQLAFTQADNRLSQTYMNTIGQSCAGYPLFQLAAAGEEQGSCWGISRCYSTLAQEAGLASVRREDNNMEADFTVAGLPLYITVRYEAVPAANAFRITTSVFNEGNETIHLTYLSSGCAAGIATDGTLPWNHKDKVRVHYFAQTWEGEGQHHEACLEDLGIYYTSVHPNTAHFSLESAGSWTTGRVLPLLFLENKETGRVWFSQYEPAGSWKLDLNCLGRWEQDSPVLQLQAGGIDPLLTGAYPLASGETYQSEPVLIGCCAGGMDEAVRALTNYRRDYLLQGKNFTDRPAFFNDYMNCIWANPSTERELPLIKAAAAAGLEGFCIDAGWYSNPKGDWNVLGKWEPCDERFGEGGLQRIIDEIRSRGMRAGLWLELEMCSDNAPMYQMPDEWFVMNYGKRAGKGCRIPVNFCNPAVRDYLHAAIDKLVAMGVSFFKNDYNMSVLRGDDSKTLPARSLKELQRAFLSFIDEVKTRHPGVMIENCASGAMRQDYATLSHFDLQSVSDQEIHTLMPAIVAGQLTAILPEQLGVWSYPFPLLYMDISRGEALFDDPSYLAQMADGEQTVFNMVSGLCGTLYQSGRIDRMDEKNFAFVREGVAFFKRERAFLAKAYPIFPLGFPQIGEKEGFICAAFEDADRSRRLLYVWRLEGEKDTVAIPLSGRGSVRQVYPASEKAACSALDSVVSVTLPKPNTARIFEWRAE